MQTITLSRAAPVLIVDASYYVFYRYFATSRWWSFQTESKASNVPPLENTAFIDAFERHITADFKRLRKRWGLTKVAPDNILFAADCPRAHIWRMDILPSYKGTRAMNDLFDPTAFSCFRDVAQHPNHHLNVVSHPRLEADDVACLLFRQIRAQAPDHRVIFITGDHDYLQLKDANCEIIGLPDKDLWLAGQKKGTHVLERKILMGDASDNIHSILSKKQLGEYFEIQDPEERTSYLARLNKTEAYERNCTLMDWARIPERFVSDFSSLVTVQI
jgi:5'-3' exonuclease